MASAELASIKPIRDWAPKHFHTRHALACRMHAAGLRNKEIAQALGLTEARVSIILNDPRASKIIAEAATELAGRLQDEVMTKIQLVAPKALQVAIDVMEDLEVHPGIRSKNAFDLLDRAGYGAVQKAIIATATISEKVADRLDKSLKESDEIPDVEYSVEPETDTESEGTAQ